MKCEQPFCSFIAQYAKMLDGSLKKNESLHVGGTLLT